jgi:hypothetical protein
MLDGPTRLFDLRAPCTNPEVRRVFRWVVRWGLPETATLRATRAGITVLTRAETGTRECSPTRNLWPTQQQPARRCTPCRITIGHTRQWLRDRVPAQVWANRQDIRLTPLAVRTARSTVARRRSVRTPRTTTASALDRRPATSPRVWLSLPRSLGGCRTTLMLHHHHPRRRKSVVRS